MKKRILIIGVSGFIGSSLRRFFDNRYPQMEVFGISRRSHGQGKNMFVCDLNHSRKLKKLLLDIRPDYIFNLSGGRVRDEKQLFRCNFQANLSLLRIISGLEGFNPRVIVPGTAAEYGVPKVSGKAISERCAVQPISFYGFVKFMQTRSSQMYARKGVDVVVARMFNIAGERVPEGLVVGRFSKDIALIENGARRPLMVTGDLSGKRDFLDVDDVCLALWELARYGKRGEVYNVCSGKSYVIRDLLAELVAFSSVKTIKIKEDHRFVSESCDIVGSNTKLKRLTKWRPKVDVVASLGRTLKYYRTLVR